MASNSTTLTMLEVRTAKALTLRERTSRNSELRREVLLRTCARQGLMNRRKNHGLHALRPAWERGPTRAES